MQEGEIFNPSPEQILDFIIDQINLLKENIYSLNEYINNIQNITLQAKESFSQALENLLKTLEGTPILINELNDLKLKMNNMINFKQNDQELIIHEEELNTNYDLLIEKFRALALKIADLDEFLQNLEPFLELGTFDESILNKITDIEEILQKIRDNLGIILHNFMVEIGKIGSEIRGFLEPKQYPS